jgi:hypothetical protein
MVTLLLAAAGAMVVVFVVWHHRSTQAQPVRFDAPVIDEPTDQALRSSYYQGRISIDTYLDRRFGTRFGGVNSTGDRTGAR